MKITLSVTKVDIGSIGGYIAPYAMHAGKLTEVWDCFDHPFWDSVRDKVAAKGVEMRRQSFCGAAMLLMSELEYTGIVENLRELDGRFVMRG